MDIWVYFTEILCTVGRIFRVSIIPSTVFVWKLCGCSREGQKRKEGPDVEVALVSVLTGKSENRRIPALILFLMM